MVSIHGPLGYEPNTLTTAPLRSCNMLQWFKLPHTYLCVSPAASDINSLWFLAPCWIRYMRSSLSIHGDSPLMPACGKSDDFVHANHCTWPCGLMDKALVFGTKDCRFESCQGHIFSLQTGFPLAVPLLQSSSSAIGYHSKNAASEDRTHDLRIMRPTRCQLRYRRSCKL